ncbi:MAG TPA: hypothetical protein DER11_03020 [Janibacter terrae]|nr:hypothetical protein [Kytococcus sp.]HCE60384.1 hypothetical protein [Janibacter terrae]
MTPGAGTVTVRRRAGEAALGGTVAAVLVLLALAGLLTSDGADTPSSVATLTLAAGFLPLGIFVLGARPGHLVGRVVLAIGLVALAAVAAAGWAHHVVAAGPPSGCGGHLWRSSRSPSWPSPEDTSPPGRDGGWRGCWCSPRP